MWTCLTCATLNQDGTPCRVCGRRRVLSRGYKILPANHRLLRTASDGIAIALSEYDRGLRNTDRTLATIQGHMETIRSVLAKEGLQNDD